MRIGIFGGAFDPIHLGHLVLAEQCREQCGLDQVWFIPTRNPPHKEAASLTLGRDRVQMLEFATAGVPEFVVSQIELDRDDVSWTIDTLRTLHAAHPEDELFLLIGGDSLRDLPTWREPEAIAGLATIVAVNRAGVAPPQVEESIRERVELVSMPDVAISATDIRHRVSSGQSIRFLVPRAVEQFIMEHGLYTVD